LTKDGIQEFNNVSADQQLEALRAILKTIDPETLKIPQSVLKLFPPRAYGYGRTRESFQSETGVSFDPLNAAATSVDMTFDLLFHPERMNRITTQHVIKNQYKSQNRGSLVIESSTSSSFSLGNILNVASLKVFNDYDKDDAYGLSIAHRNQELFLNHLMNLMASTRTNIDVKATARDQLNTIEKDLSKRDSFENQLLSQIKQFNTHPELFKVKKLPAVPDGSPIGCGYPKE
jgi:hypothetical protein